MCHTKSCESWLRVMYISLTFIPLKFSLIQWWAHLLLWELRLHVHLLNFCKLNETMPYCVHVKQTYTCTILYHCQCNFLVASGSASFPPQDAASILLLLPDLHPWVCTLMGAAGIWSLRLRVKAMKSVLTTWLLVYWLVIPVIMTVAIVI